MDFHIESFGLILLVEAIPFNRLKAFKTFLLMNRQNQPMRNWRGLVIFCLMDGKLLQQGIY